MLRAILCDKRYCCPRRSTRGKPGRRRSHDLSGGLWGQGPRQTPSRPHPQADTSRNTHVHTDGLPSPLRLCRYTWIQTHLHTHLRSQHTHVHAHTHTHRRVQINPDVDTHLHTQLHSQLTCTEMHIPSYTQTHVHIPVRIHWDTGTCPYAHTHPHSPHTPHRPHNHTCTDALSHRYPSTHPHTFIAPPTCIHNHQRPCRCADV